MIAYNHLQSYTSQILVIFKLSLTSYLKRDLDKHNSNKNNITTWIRLSCKGSARSFTPRGWTQGPRATSGPPHYFMWPARAYDCLKIKICATLYRKLWKCVSIPQVSVSIWCSIYTQKWTLVCIWYAVVMIRGVGFFGSWRLWTAQKNNADLTLKKTSCWTNLKKLE